MRERVLLFVVLAITVLALAGFAVASVLSGNSAYIAWAAAPLLMIGATIVIVLRGQRLGEAKRERDARGSGTRRAPRVTRASATD